MLRRLRREEGQVLPLVAAGLLVVFLGFSALLVDVGRAYLVRRQLQATADAAAIAAADALPDIAAAQAAATAYGGSSTGKNKIAGQPVSETVTPWCLKSLPYCYGNTPGAAPANGQANGLVIQESATVSTLFAKAFGFDSFTINAKATACGLCGSTPLDVALIVDRTGSMNLNMTDLRNGVKALLQALDPGLVYVSLIALPPDTSATDDCAAPDTNVTYAANNWVLTPLANDYKTGSALNASSPIVGAINCIPPGGATSYKPALMAAYDQLVNHGSGRPGVQKVVILESDGAANTVPSSWENGTNAMSSADAHWDDVKRPCGSSVDYANNVIKPAGITVFTVGYALQADEQCYVAPHYEMQSGKKVLVGYKTVTESTTATSAMASMASPNSAFSQATQSDMTALFVQVASKLMGGTLVPDSEAG